MSQPPQQSVTTYLVFIGFVWFSQQTAIISLNSTVELIFVVQTRLVFFEVGTECLNVFCMIVVLVALTFKCCAAFKPRNRNCKLIWTEDNTLVVLWVWACGSIWTTVAKRGTNKVQPTDQEKISAGRWLLWCGTGAVFTTRWTRGLLSVRNVVHQRLILLHAD
jgi:hypothetical protein